jgi:HAD superfamily hydrolase (TIGR01490 family)
MVKKSGERTGSSLHQNTVKVSHKHTQVAIFDVDGTIFRSSLLIELVEGLITAGLFEWRVRSEYSTQYVHWLNRRGEYETYIEAVIRAFIKHIKGIYYGDFAEVAEKVIIEQQHRVYRYTRDLSRDLKKQGYYLLAISQSPKTILDSFCKSMGFDKVYGRVYEIGPQDKFTGDVVEYHLIANKANIVRRAVEKENLTLEGSVGVGDTEGDIPFLELVERPICFNPNAKLYNHARRMGWQVVVERKDVIYML